MATMPWKNRNDACHWRAVLRLEFVETCDRRVEIIVRQKTQQPRRGKADDLFIFLIHDARQHQRRIGCGVVKSFKGGEFGGLVFGHALRADMAGERLAGAMPPGPRRRLNLRDLLANSWCFCFSRYQALTLTTRNAAAVQAPQRV